MNWKELKKINSRTNLKTEDRTMDKYLGSLFGLAIGDALGAPVEFKKVGEFDPITDFSDSGRLGLPAGCWSDDTAMTLCLANSLAEKQGFDAQDQREKYLRWIKEGYCSSTGQAIGVGQTVLRALLSDDIEALSFRRSDGNGSLMRIAPIALFFKDQPLEAAEYAARSSKVTHASELCVEACQYYVGLIIGALGGVSKDDLLSPLYFPITGFWENKRFNKEVEVVICGSYKNSGPPVIQGSGYVVKSMEAALWAFYNSSSFEEGVLLAVNLGDDADTTAAIYGQLAGAYYGLSQIPDNWVKNIAKGNEIKETAMALATQRVV